MHMFYLDIFTRFNTNFFENRVYPPRIGAWVCDQSLGFRVIYATSV